jgi:hypothetical protein
LDDGEGYKAGTEKYDNYSLHCAFGDAQILARVHPRKKIGQCSCMDKCCPHATASLDLLRWNKDIVSLCVLVRGEGGESYWIIGGVRWSAHLAKAGRRREGENELAGRPLDVIF